MDQSGVSPVIAVVGGLAALVVVIAAIGGIMYMSDAKVTATIVDKECKASLMGKSSLVMIKTKFPIPGIERTLTGFDDRLCTGLRAGESGNYVEYSLKSERVVLYEREGGSCIYDSNQAVC